MPETTQTPTDLMPGMRIVEQDEWYQVWLDTPISTPGGPLRHQLGREPTEAEAFAYPGCCVKSIERADGPHSWPKYHGRMQSYSESRVIVAAHASKLPTDPWFIWEGTAAEYERLWLCD